MTLQKQGGLSELLKEWGPLITTIIAMTTFVLGFIKTEATKDAQITILVESQKEISSEMKEVRLQIQGYNAIISDIRSIDKKNTENSDRILKLETLQAERATAVASLKTVSDLQTKLIDGLTSDIRALQGRLNNH